MRWPEERAQPKNKSRCQRKYMIYANTKAIHSVIVWYRYDAKISALYQLPDRLIVKEKERSEDMLSNQMLSGIPEVNLGLE